MDVERYFGSRIHNMVSELNRRIEAGKPLILIFLFLVWTTEKQTVLLPKEDKIWNGTYSSPPPIISPPLLQRKCCHSLEGFFGQM